MAEQASLLAAFDKLAEQQLDLLEDAHKQGHRYHKVLKKLGVNDRKTVPEFFEQIDEMQDDVHIAEQRVQNLEQSAAELQAEAAALMEAIGQEQIKRQTAEAEFEEAWDIMQDVYQLVCEAADDDTEIAQSINPELSKSMRRLSTTRRSIMHRRDTLDPNASSCPQPPASPLPLLKRRQVRPAKHGTEVRLPQLVVEEEHEGKGQRKGTHEQHDQDGRSNDGASSESDSDYTEDDENTSSSGSSNFTSSGTGGSSSTTTTTTTDTSSLSTSFDDKDVVLDGPSRRINEWLENSIMVNEDRFSPDSIPAHLNGDDDDDDDDDDTNTTSMSMDYEEEDSDDDEDEGEEDDEGDEEEEEILRKFDEQERQEEAESKHEHRPHKPKPDWFNVYGSTTLARGPASTDKASEGKGSTVHFHPSVKTGGEDDDGKENRAQQHHEKKHESNKKKHKRRSTAAAAAITATTAKPKRSMSRGRPYGGEGDSDDDDDDDADDEIASPPQAQPVQKRHMQLDCVEEQYRERTARRIREHDLRKHSSATRQFTCRQCSTRIRRGEKHQRCWQCTQHFHERCAAEGVPATCEPPPFFTSEGKKRKPVRPGFNLQNDVFQEAMKNNCYTLVPRIVEDCVRQLDRRGPKSHGIYRIPGTKAQVDRLWDGFFKDERPPSLYTHAELADIASLLKLYLRGLDEPLLTFDLYPVFACAVKDDHLREDKVIFDDMCKVIQELPPINFFTLDFVMKHLKRLSKHAESTGMTLTNLAVCFGPSIMWPRQQNISAIPISNKVAEYLIRIPRRRWRAMQQEFLQRSNLITDVSVDEKKQKKQQDAFQKKVKKRHKQELKMSRKNSNKNRGPFGSLRNKKGSFHLA